MLLDLTPLPLGRRIKILRIYADLTVPNLASLWDTSVDRVYRIEKDVEGTRPPTRLELAALLGLVEAASPRGAPGEAQRFADRAEDARGQVEEADQRARRRDTG